MPVNSHNALPLHGKTAVIHGGGGAIGGAVARAFARDGAQVFIAGRSRAKLERVREAIVATGGVAEVAEVDALDEAAVNDHIDAVARMTGRIDITLNAAFVASDRASAMTGAIANLSCGALVD